MARKHISKACSCSCCVVLQQNDLETCQMWESIHNQTNTTILTLFSSTWELELINLQVQGLIFLLYFRTVLISQSCQTKHASTRCSSFSKIHFLYLLHLKVSRSTEKNMYLTKHGNDGDVKHITMALNRSGRRGCFSQGMLEISSDWGKSPALHASILPQEMEAASLGH